MSYINVSSYRFVSLSKTVLPDIRTQLKKYADELQLKGTVLLSSEGINLFVSGTVEQIQQYRSFLSQWDEFRDLWFKESVSHHQPFTRMLVRIKKEVIAMGHHEIKPEENKTPYIDPEKLKQWLDENKDVVILDTRNDYETRIGAFDNAIDLNIHTFRDFPAAIEQLPDELKQKTIVTYCTGGIRCEKAAIYMKEKGFENVYQLEGGILNYFEKCGGEHYHGECFVFDKRVAVDSDLKETAVKQCYSCRQPLAINEQIDDETCPHCHRNWNGKRFYAHLSKAQKQALGL